MFKKESLIKAKQAADIYRGSCAPNPAVGAILVKSNEIIAIGAHQGCGMAHAEVEAIAAAGEKARGATLYVTLEPCCHHGRTPPCTDAIIKAGIETVYYAYKDPNPIVSGKGAAILSQAGIPCHHLELPAINAMYRAYSHWVNTKKPYVRAKLACSFDGKVAHAGGEPAVISGDEAAEKTAQDRRYADAILTSVATVLADDPQLNARDASGITAKPVWVLDRELKCPESARLWQTASELVLCHAEGLSSEKTEALSKKEGRLQALPVDASGHFIWEALFAEMGQQGLHEVWVEAGPRLTESLLASGYLNELIVSFSPCVLGAKAMPGFRQVTDLSVGAKSIEWEALGETARCVIRY